MCYSPDGLHLASSGSDGKVRIWDATTGEMALTLKGWSRELHCVEFCPRGRYLAAGVTHTGGRIWEKPDDSTDRRARSIVTWRAREAAGFQARRQWAPAIIHLEHLIAADPSSGSRWFDRGNCHAERNNWLAAEADFAKAVELQPDIVHHWYRQAMSAGAEDGRLPPRPRGHD